ncbi:hypothetical protein F5Y15DRAFT_412228 [Xylariaceae sp. FL0016]|nr:hypothetical protein F5Y15DRAFT_412228 [Xylariaceae sp. FL0016]
MSAASLGVRLRHISLPYHASNAGYPTYALATAIQTKLQQDLLSWKARASSSPHRDPAPPPTLLSFTPAPTYTLGRRQTAAPLAEAEIQRLRAPLEIPPTHDIDISSSRTRVFRPAVARAPRGGLATYHGPGQTVLWPVLDLHSDLHRRFSVRDYACLLEKTTIAALARWGLRAHTTDNPGVWVRTSRRGRHGTGVEGKGEVEVEEKVERKIAALGVHLRRHVTGLGVAVNWRMDTNGAEGANPWARINACGLGPGERGTTSIWEELVGQGLGLGADGGGDGVRSELPERPVLTGGAAPISLDQLWAQEFARRLGVGYDVEAREEIGLEASHHAELQRSAPGLDAQEYFEAGR